MLAYAPAMTIEPGERTSTTDRNGIAIAAGVVGIVALALAITIVFFQVSGPLALAGVVLGIIGVRRWRRLGGRTIAHVGLWLSVAALLIDWTISFSRL